MEEIWRRPIRCYVSPAGNNKIADWYDALSITEQADADVFLTNIRRERQWSMPEYRSKLKGLKGIGELRWFSENKQHRLLGYFDGEDWVALVGCKHKGKIYDPTDTLKTAEKRRSQIDRGEAATIEYDL